MFFCFASRSLSVLLPNWHKRLNTSYTNRAARRRRGKFQPSMQTLESRALLSVNPTAATISAIEATAFTGTVASFTSTDPLADLSATINWGDGTVDAGTVVDNGGGSFDVTGTHIFGEDGPTTIAVVISDSADASTGTATSTTNVAEGDFALTAGGPINATEGLAVTNFQVATFNDADGTDPASDYTATIDWGDGTVDAGTIAGSNGQFTVTGDHTYMDELSGSYSVTVSEPAANFTIGPAGNTVNVTEGDSGTLVSATITATEGQVFSGTVGSFTDNFLGQVATDFTASVDWGDGTITAGTVSGSTGGPFTILGDHTYADEGTFAVLASFSDDPPSTLNATIASSAVVAEGDALTGTGTTITPIELTAFNGVVATFSNSGYPNNAATDFTANIDWGDGTIDVGVPATGGSGADLTVSGTHTYAEDGPYVITTVISDDAPGTATATATSTANVGEAALSITGVAIAATEGQAFSGTLATATDPGSLDPANDYSATVDWGDGTVGAGTISGSAGAYTISGSHTYLDEGAHSAAVTFFENSDPTFPISINDPVTVAEGDTLAPIVVTTGSISENQLTGGLAAEFSDTGYPANSPADFTGTFDWGDGTTFTTGGGNVSITSDGAGTFMLSVAGHSYADEGVYTVVATLTDDAPGTATLAQTGTLTVTEADAFTPAATPLTLTGTEGVSVNGNVAVFADTGYPGNNPVDFSAAIDWGDGTVGAGTVSAIGDGSFTVSGAHAYADDGAYTITATIADDAPGTATSTTTALANIAEAGLTLSAAVATFVATEGTTASGIVATLTDPGSSDPATDYSATIDWGDGTVTNGTVSGAGGSYLVNGGHAYSDEGVYTVKVTATENSAVPAASVTATLIADLVEGDVLLGSAAAISVTEGSVFNGTSVATFNDTGFPGNVAADFSATIDWGDGTIDAGTVSGTGTFTVSGNHAYADEGSYPVSVVITDDAPGTASATATTTATVAEGDAGALISATISPTEGQTFSGAVATFTDTGYPDQVASDFTANIDWGDGTITTGTVTGGSGIFTISGSHSYAEEGTFTILASFSDDPPSTLTNVSITSTAVVADAPLSAIATTIASTEGLSFTGVVANFTDANPGGTVADFTATITWGDGATTAGTVSPNGVGGFQVTGTHTYAEEGTDSITVAIADVGGSTATANSTANVADATLTAASATAAATEGASFTGVVANFTDANPGGTVADFTATITWGDGATTAGTVSPNGVGGFQVTGTHTYAEEGTNSITVAIADVGGSTATANSTANVADATLMATATTITSPEYTSFSGIVATFTDADPNGAATDYTATVDWGDGTTTAGVIGTAGSAFNVTGSHVYAEDGTHTITVTIADVGGSTATASSTANITEPGISATPVAVSGFERSSAADITVATFTHGNGGEPAGGFAAAIDWGDGTSSMGTVSESGTTYKVSGAHTYLDEGKFPVTVQVTDDTASATITANAIIKEELLPNGNEGTPNQRFIQEVYRDLLHRAVDASGLAFWTNLLDQGQSRLQVVSSIIAGSMHGELGADLVTGIFEKYLGRDPDPVGLAFWVGIISQHETIEQTESNIVGTPEFFTLAGSTNNGFITRLFGLALGRSPEASALANFNAALAAGYSREQVAEIVFGSHEFHQDEIAGYYQSKTDPNDLAAGTVPFIDDLDFLDRPADAGGLSAFTAALDAGVLDQVVWANMISSDEFYAKIS
jgi:hypothetical protein